MRLRLGEGQIDAPQLVPSSVSGQHARRGTYLTGVGPVSARRRENTGERECPLVGHVVAPLLDEQRPSVNASASKPPSCGRTSPATIVKRLTDLGRRRRSRFRPHRTDAVRRRSMTHPHDRHLVPNDPTSPAMRR
jgi:hypothetical protein